MYKTNSIFLEPFSHNLTSFKKLTNNLIRLQIYKNLCGYNLRYSNALIKFKEKVNNNKWEAFIYQLSSRKIFRSMEK